MPRKYKRKTSRGSWSSESMVLAVRAVLDNEMGYLKASRTYGVPQSTLEDRVRKIRKGEVSPNKGSQKKGLGRHHPVFSKTQEEELVKYILVMEERLFGLTLTDVRRLAFELAERNGIPHSFNHAKKRAGKDWLYGFLERNPTLSLRSPEQTSLARAKGFNRVAVNQFYDLLESLMVKNHFLPQNIYNVDETGILTVPNKASKVLARKGKKQVGALTSSERGVLVTTEICMNAAGNYMAPMFVFPRKKANPRLMIGAPPGSFATYHSSGWIQKDLFLVWFEKFIQFANPSAQNPVLLILDGHASHTKSVELINRARDNHVHILCLPPHCTHRLQPLDVSFMLPLNTYYEQEARNWMIQNPGCAITIYEVAQIFSQAFGRAAVMQTAVNGFRETGISPFNRNAIPDHLYIPSETTDHPLNIDQQQQLDHQPSTSALSKTSDNPSTLQVHSDQPSITPGSPTPGPSTGCSIATRTPLQQHDHRPSTLEPQENDAAYSAQQTRTQSPKPGPSSDTSFLISPEEIRPFPKEKEKRKRRVNRNRGATDILTSSPYKAKLMETLSKTEKSPTTGRKPRQKSRGEKEMRNAKGADKEEAQKKKKKGKKRKISSSEGEEEEDEVWVPSSDEDNEECTDACMHCNALLSDNMTQEEWSACSVCKELAHDSCSGFDPAQQENFVCDFCKTLAPEVTIL
uniref:Tigger transposable element-derived protein 6 n=1 Tax=Lygus hesperus TaxID=30085 RepID=A0A146KT86_LYGHE